MSDTNEYYLVAFPNGNSGAASTLRSLQGSVGDVAEIFPFDVPKMKVGTLERLMAAGDSLAKTDSSVESVIRKIERAYEDVKDGLELRIENSDTLSYVKNFRWASAKYQANRSIDELVKVITQTVQKIDDELKEVSASYQESKHELNALQRKKGGNLMANLHEHIKKVDLSGFMDTEYLITLAVILPRNNEQEFLKSYENLAPDAVGYGPAENRQSVLGSPVVPGSAKLLLQDNDGYMLYAVTILKMFQEDFTQACQKARYTVRDVVGGKKEENDDDNEDSTPEARFANAEVEFDEARNQLRRWAQTHYGEAFVAWMHVKTIRVFVEAVLLYGLPVDFVAALIHPKKKSNEKKIRERLSELFTSILGEDYGGTDMDASTLPNLPGASSEYYPYVSFTFKPLPGE